MAELVEGDWKDFTFKMAKPDNYPAILEHLHLNFYQDEPMTKYLGQGELKTKDMDAIAVVFLEQGLSFVAVHKETGKVAGVRVTGIARKEDNIEELFSLLQSSELQALIPNILELHKEANTYERLNIDHYGDFLFVSVDKEFRGQGLATEIYSRAIELLKSKGVPAAESIFTSPYSQRIAKKKGFVELTRRYFKDYKSPDGTRLLPDAADDEVAIVMAIKF